MEDAGRWRSGGRLARWLVAGSVLGVGGRWSVLGEGRRREVLRDARPPWSWSPESRFTARLTGGFALVAVLLAVIGVYGGSSTACPRPTWRLRGRPARAGGGGDARVLGAGAPGGASGAGSRALGGVIALEPRGSIPVSAKARQSAWESDSQALCTSSPATRTLSSGRCCLPWAWRPAAAPGPAGRASRSTRGPWSSPRPSWPRWPGRDARRRATAARVSRAAATALVYASDASLLTLLRASASCRSNCSSRVRYFLAVLVAAIVGPGAGRFAGGVLGRVADVAGGVADLVGRIVRGVADIVGALANLVARTVRGGIHLVAGSPLLRSLHPVVRATASAAATKAYFLIG